MEFVPGLTARDLPVPPTINQIVEEFGVPVFTFVSQPHLEEASYGTVGMDGVLVEMSLCYGVYRHTGDREHPSNFAEDIESTLSAIEKAQSDNQPAWFMNALRQRRHPTMWEAVRTVKLGFDAERPLAQRLAEHVNHVLINTIENRRHPSPDGPLTLDNEVTARHAQPGVTLNIDGTDVEALMVDTDPDVVGWAAEVDDCAVLVAFSRDFAAMIDIALERRQAAVKSGI